MSLVTSIIASQTLRHFSKHPYLHSVCLLTSFFTVWNIFDQFMLIMVISISVFSLGVHSGWHVEWVDGSAHLTRLGCWLAQVHTDTEHQPLAWAARDWSWARPLHTGEQSGYQPDILDPKFGHFYRYFWGIYGQIEPCTLPIYLCEDSSSDKKWLNMTREWSSGWCPPVLPWCTGLSSDPAHGNLETWAGAHLWPGPHMCPRLSLVNGSQYLPLMGRWSCDQSLEMLGHLKPTFGQQQLLLVGVVFNLHSFPHTKAAPAHSFPSSSNTFKLLTSNFLSTQRF